MSNVIEQQRKKIEELQALAKRNDTVMTGADKIIKNQRNLINELQESREAVERISEYRLSGIMKLTWIVIKRKFNR